MLKKLFLLSAVTLLTLTGIAHVWAIGPTKSISYGGGVGSGVNKNKTNRENLAIDGVIEESSILDTEDCSGYSSTAPNTFVKGSEGDIPYALERPIITGVVYDDIAGTITVTGYDFPPAPVVYLYEDFENYAAGDSTSTWEPPIGKNEWTRGVNPILDSSSDFNSRDVSGWEDWTDLPNIDTLPDDYGILPYIGEEGGNKHLVLEHGGVTDRITQIPEGAQRVGFQPVALTRFFPDGEGFAEEYFCVFDRKVRVYSGGVASDGSMNTGGGMELLTYCEYADPVWSMRYPGWGPMLVTPSSTEFGLSGGPIIHTGSREPPPVPCLSGLINNPRSDFRWLIYQDMALNNWHTINMHSGFAGYDLDLATTSTHYSAYPNIFEPGDLHAWQSTTGHFQYSDPDSVHPDRGKFTGIAFSNRWHGSYEAAPSGPGKNYIDIDNIYVASNPSRVFLSTQSSYDGIEFLQLPVHSPDILWDSEGELDTIVVEANLRGYEPEELYIFVSTGQENRGTKPYGFLQNTTKTSNPFTLTAGAPPGYHSNARTTNFPESTNSCYYTNYGSGYWIDENYMYDVESTFIKSTEYWYLRDNSPGEGSSYYTYLSRGVTFEMHGNSELPKLAWLATSAPGNPVRYRVWSENTTSPDRAVYLFPDYIGVSVEPDGEQEIQLGYYTPDGKLQIRVWDRHFTPIDFNVEGNTEEPYAGDLFHLSGKIHFPAGNTFDYNAEPTVTYTIRNDITGEEITSDPIPLIPGLDILDSEALDFIDGLALTVGAGDDLVFNLNKHTDMTNRSAIAINLSGYDIGFSYDAPTATFQVSPPAGAAAGSREVEIRLFDINDLLIDTASVYVQVVPDNFQFSLEPTEDVVAAGSVIEIDPWEYTDASDTSSAIVYAECAYGEVVYNEVTELISYTPPETTGQVVDTVLVTIHRFEYDMNPLKFSIAVTVLNTTPNRNPEYNNGSVIALINNTTSFSLNSLFSDPDRDELIYEAIDGAHVAVLVSDKICTIEPEPDWSGTDTITITAYDGSGGFTAANVEVRVGDIYPPAGGGKK